MTATAPTKEATGILEKTLHVGERVAQAVIQTERVKDQLTHAVEDVKTEAKRYAKRTRRAAEDLSEEAAHRIKHDPFSAVAITFGAGFLLGTLVSWAVAQRSKAGQEEAS